MPIQLTNEQLQFIQQTLSGLLPDAQFFAFGSRAKGSAKRYSDIDILIINKVIIPLITLSQLNEIFTESNLPFKVDLVDWHRITEEFREHIEKEGMVNLMSAKSSHPSA